jgi:[ribosomal protein S5]-alanine N-acetyltransferase
MNDLSITTARLLLVPTTIEHLEAELHAPHRLPEMLGVVVPAGWPPGLYDRDAMEFFHARMLEAGTAAAGWFGWYAIRRATTDGPAILVASGGYLGPPASDGTVEIGYSVVPEYRNQGYATELVSALTNRALTLFVAGVRRVVAEVDEQNGASQKVLRRCGFAPVGSGREPGHTRFQHGPTM